MKKLLFISLLLNFLIANSQSGELSYLVDEYSYKELFKGNYQPAIFEKSSEILLVSDQKRTISNVELQVANREINLEINHSYNVYPLTSYYVEGRYFMSMEGLFIPPYDIRNNYLQILKR